MLKLLVIIFLINGIFCNNKICPITNLQHILIGINFEYSYIKTPDNYVLGLLKLIPERSISNSKIVLLVHGITDSMDNFLINKNGSLGKYLLSKGYIVYLMNNRGNKYSRYNTEHDVNTKEFWDFSFDELAKYDLTTVVNHIYETYNKKIYIIGHSQGTTQTFAALSEDYESINDKVIKFLAISPVIYLNKLEERKKHMMPEGKLFFKLLHLFGAKEIFQSDCVERIKSFYIVQKVCKYMNFMCKLSIDMLDDDAYKYIDMKHMDYYLKYYPSGSSLRQFQHFLQLSELKNDNLKLFKFDYGKHNINHYGTKDVPHYNLNNIRIPVVLYSGYQDNLAVIESIEQVIKDYNKLNVINFYKYYNFGHTSIFWALDNTLLFNNIIEHLA